MAKYQCLACPYVYNEDKGDLEHGIKEKTKFSDIPDTWVCPVCGVGKDMFKLIPERKLK